MPAVQGCLYAEYIIAYANHTVVLCNYNAKGMWLLHQPLFNYTKLTKALMKNQEVIRRV